MDEAGLISGWQSNKERVTKYNFTHKSQRKKVFTRPSVRNEIIVLTCRFSSSSSSFSSSYSSFSFSFSFSFSSLLSSLSYYYHLIFFGDVIIVWYYRVVIIV